MYTHVYMYVYISIYNRNILSTLIEHNGYILRKKLYYIGYIILDKFMQPQTCLPTVTVYITSEIIELFIEGKKQLLPEEHFMKFKRKSNICHLYFQSKNDLEKELFLNNNNETILFKQ